MSLTLSAVLASALINGQTKPTVGTVQLAGDNGKLKTTYQLGAKGNELHFTLDSARTDTIFPAPEDIFVAGENQRLLILNFTVQNPQSKEMSLAPSSFSYTCVSPDDENFLFRGYLLSGVNQKRISQSLKPAQKVKCTVVLPIYAEGDISKVMIARGENNPILRYDLTGKLTPKMTSVFSPNGFDLINTVNAPNPVVDFGEYELGYEGIEFTKEKIKGYAPSDGYKYLVVNLNFKNRITKNSFLSFAYINPLLADSNGQKYVWNKDLLFRATDDTIYQDLVAGDPALKTRMYYQVKENVNEFTFSLQHVSSKRTVKFL